MRISESCVSYTLKNYKIDSCESKLIDCGRKKILSNEEINFVISLVEKNRKISAPKIAKIIQEKFNKKVSSKTIIRYISLGGLKAGIPRKVPYISEKNKKERLAFAKKYINKPNSFWKKVLWSDETKINLFGSDGCTRVWKRKGESLDDNCTKKP
jgi:hypothetical protein